MSYGNQGGNNYPQREKNVFDDRKFRLSVKNENGKWANLNFGLYQNNPRITVYTGVEGDKDNGRISGNMDTPAFYSFLNLFSQVIDFKPTEEARDIKFKIENKRPNFQKGGGRPQGTVTESELWVGKTSKGVVWLSVTGYNRPKIQFPFGNPEYHAFFMGDGTPMTEGEVSVLYAKAYLQALYGMLPILKVDNFVDVQAKQKQGGGGGYGGNGGGQSQGGGQSGGGSARSSGFDSDADDDIPF